MQKKGAKSEPSLSAHTGAPLRQLPENHVLLYVPHCQLETQLPALGYIELVSRYRQVCAFKIKGGGQKARTRNSRLRLRPRAPPRSAPPARSSPSRQPARAVSVDGGRVAPPMRRVQMQGGPAA